MNLLYLWSETNIERFLPNNLKRSLIIHWHNSREPAVVDWKEQLIRNSICSYTFTRVWEFSVFILELTVCRLQFFSVAPGFESFVTNCFIEEPIFSKYQLLSKDWPGRRCNIFKGILLFEMCRFPFYFNTQLNAYLLWGQFNHNIEFWNWES